MYKKLASCDDEDDLFRLQGELVDRYGKLPEPARSLIETHQADHDRAAVWNRSMKHSPQTFLI